AQWRLAAGEVEGGTDILAIHKQLRQVLDPKAARGPLGGELLGRGRTTLALAAGAWKKSGKDDLASSAEKFLDKWGDVPPPAVAAGPGRGRAEVARVFGSKGKGKVVPALSARALDLLALPVPDDGCESVIATFDRDDRLAEVLVTYGPGADEDY